MKSYKQMILKGIFSAGIVLGMSNSALAGQILLINGSSTTLESGTTADITTNLNNVLTAAGNMVTVVDAVPVSFTGYSQVWDLRFSNSGALTSGDQAQYLSYLQGGGGMFLMGENAGFMTRNTSILDLIAAAGGGTINYTDVSWTQTVNAPFNGPNVIPGDVVNYAAPGGLDSAGNGAFITSSGGTGTGVAFGVGHLTNATAGALTTIFDVNFMQGSFDQPNSQQLLQNLAGFVADQVEPPPADVPEPASLALLGLGALCLLGRRKGSAAL
jgi:hypothetical protein